MGMLQNMRKRRMRTRDALNAAQKARGKRALKSTVVVVPKGDASADDTPAPKVPSWRDIMGRPLPKKGKAKGLRAPVKY
jgi:hypothetical protein